MKTQSSPARPKFPVRGRFILVFWILPFIFVPGIDFIYELIADDAPWFWFAITWSYYNHLLFALLFMTFAVVYRLRWQAVFNKPMLHEFLDALELTIFIIVFSMAAAFALFYPLSFVLPDFVNYWYIGYSPIIYAWGESYPVLPNLLGFFSLVILTPIIEEIAFRGFLLHRWADKFGIIRGVIYSSFLFGVVHPDPIGAFAFGVAMCFLYMKSKTLIVPIVCHALTNLIAWSIQAGYFYVNGPYQKYTLQDFQSEWAIGFVWILLSTAWIYKYFKSDHRSSNLGLPVIEVEQRR